MNQRVSYEATSFLSTVAEKSSGSTAPGGDQRPRRAFIGGFKVCEVSGWYVFVGFSRSSGLDVFFLFNVFF